MNAEAKGIPKLTSDYFIQLKYRGEIKDRLGVWFGLKLVGLAAGNWFDS